MKASRLFLPFLVAVALAFAASAHAETEWLTDFQQAKEKAKADNKLLLVDFTGSDWCGWCIKLHREVFSKPEFHAYASKNLVLLEVDFPQRKQIERAQLEKNKELALKFGIEGFPTLVVLNSDGKVIGSLGYDAGVPEDSQRPEATPAAFIASLEKLKKG